MQFLSSRYSTRLPSERINYFSHLAGALLWIPLTIWLLIISWPDPLLMVVSLVYGLAAFAMFATSAHYHRHKAGENERNIRRTMDHFMIFVMIAGSYTPIIMVWFLEQAKWITLGLQWGLTLAGFILALAVPKRPRWVDPVLYVAMGWVAIGLIGWLWSLMSRLVFVELIAGGVLYTLGALVYALKRPILKPGVFGFHELFHLFVLAGAGVHFAMILHSLGQAMSR